MNQKIKKIKILFGLEAADYGTLKHLSSLVENLDRNRYHLTVVLSPKRSERVYSISEKMKRFGAVIKLLPMEREIKPLKDIVILLKIIKLIRLERFDVVHAHSSKAGLIFRLAARICRVPKIIYTPHCFFFQSKQGYEQKLFVIYEKLMAKLTTKIVVSINESQWARNFRIASEEKLVVINNAINPRDYVSDKARDYDFGLEAGHLIVCGVGRLTHQKDWPTFIAAAKLVIQRFPHVSFLITGDGEQLCALRHLTKHLNIEKRMVIAGHIDEIGDVFNIADMIVSSSLWEGLPYVLLEAMHYSKPIIAANIGYQGVIADGVNGLLFHSRDAVHLSEKISFLLQQQTLRPQLGRMGKQMAAVSFNFDKFIKKHEKLYLASH